MWILFLTRASGCVFVRPQSSCVMWITSGLFSSCSAVFEKWFDYWTTILSSPLLVTFTETKYLTLPSTPISNSFPMACSKDFHKKSILCFWMNYWRKFTMNLFLNSNDGLSEHIISCTAPELSKWLQQRPLQYPYLCHYLKKLNMFYILTCKSMLLWKSSHTVVYTRHSVRRLGIVRIEDYIHEVQ